MELSSTIRKPAVAGSFYPFGQEELEQLIHQALLKEQQDIEKTRITGSILGGVVPHAGMKFCAFQTVHFFEHLRQSGQQPDTVVLVHPNHYRQGAAISVDGHHFWSTPLGKVAVDKSFLEALQLPAASQALDQEHSAEVIVPYLQYFLKPGFRIVAVNMVQQDLHMASRLAWKVRAAQTQLKRRVLFIASSDFSHYLPPAEGRHRDAYVLQEILNRDAAGVQQAVRLHQASLCGYGPIMALMEYCRMKDPEYHAHILRQGHSGEVLPMPQVVRYVSILMDAPLRQKG